MRKTNVFGTCLLMFVIIILSLTTIHAQEGFSGPFAGLGANNPGSFYQPATVSQLNLLQRNGQRDAEVVLTGFIVNLLRENRYYTFRDNTGEVEVRIDQRYWGGITIGPNDRVQIFGRAERRSNGSLRVEARIIRRI